MTENEFQDVLKRRLHLIIQVLSNKGEEYAQGENRLHNFDAAARISKQSREKALWGMALKHYVSFMDIIDDIEYNGTLPTVEYVEEKIGDLINYLILAEASIKDKIAKR